MMVKKVTLDEISKEINVSRTTIYKIINDKGHVSEKTRHKVQTALEKYKYVPNYNARDLARGKKYRIGYIGMRHLSATYFSVLVNEGLNRAYNDFVDNGLEILIEESDFDNPHKQLEDIEKMRKMGIENFIISPSDVLLMKPKIEELQQQGCHVIQLSRYVDIPRRTYVGVNYYNSGRLAGEMLTKIMPEGGRIVIVTNRSPEADNTVRGRYMGFLDFVSQDGRFQIVETIENVNTNDQALGVFDSLCKNYDNLNNIDAVYDITYKLNILAKKLLNLPGKKIKLIGFDVYPEIVEYVKSSVVDILIGQQLSDQAYDATRMLFQKICYGIDYMEKDYYSNLNVIVASNIDCFV